MTQIARATNEACGEATGTVVVIDVLRAFTTAAFAFAAGTGEIVPVSGVDEALALRERFPGSYVMGKVYEPSYNLCAAASQRRHTQIRKTSLEVLRPSKPPIE